VVRTEGLFVITNCNCIKKFYISPVYVRIYNNRYCWMCSPLSFSHRTLFWTIQAVQQSLSIGILLLPFRFKPLIHLPFLLILNYWTASILLKNIYKNIFQIFLNNLRPIYTKKATNVESTIQYRKIFDLTRLYFPVIFKPQINADERGFAALYLRYLHALQA
jgi:hypothetical protein